MAFKMKGSPHKRGGIHGTHAHKRSIAKAVAEQYPIVAQTRTQADPNLIRAAGDYAESDYTSKDIDYSLTFPEIEGVTLEEDKYWTESYDQYVTRMTEQGRDPISRAAWMTARDEEGDYPEEENGGGDVPPGMKRCICYGEVVSMVREDAECPDCPPANPTDPTDGNSFAADTRSALDPSQVLESNEGGGSPYSKRDDRIWQSVVKGGKVQENMLKSGYLPPHLR